LRVHVPPANKINEGAEYMMTETHGTVEDGITSVK